MPVAKWFGRFLLVPVPRHRVAKPRRRAALPLFWALYPANFRRIKSSKHFVPGLGLIQVGDKGLKAVCFGESRSPYAILH